MEKKYYLGFTIAGFILPYSQFVSFLLENGLNTSLIIQQIVGYKISALAWLDVAVTVIVLIAIINEEKEQLTHMWLPIFVTLIIGPSYGLPLFMYLRN